MNTKRIMDNARAALADTRTPAQVATDATAEKLGAALGKAEKLSDVLASIAHDLDVCASSDTIDAQEVCASLATELRERAKIEAAKDAAAPDLLAVCKEIAEHGTDDWEARMRTLRAAIARAEGGGK